MLQVQGEVAHALRGSLLHMSVGFLVECKSVQSRICVKRLAQRALFGFRALNAIQNVRVMTLESGIVTASR